MKIRYTLSFITLLLSNLIIAQNTHFSQFYASSIYLNPALAGLEAGSKLTLNYRNQWPGISNSFITHNASFEKRIASLNAGIGINAFRDQAGDGMLAISSYSGVYAQEVKLGKELFVRGGIKFGYVQKTINWNDLVFEDMIDSRGGVIYSTQQEFGSSISNIDLSTGLFLYSDSYYGGFTVNHVNKPKGGLINNNGESINERQFTIHGGAKFWFSFQEKYSISPNLLLSKQGSFSMVNVGAYLESTAITVGFWYGSHNRMIAMLGLKGKHFRIGYSYDINMNIITGNALGSHEISYAYSFRSKKRNKRYKTTLCPSF